MKYAIRSVDFPKSYLCQYGDYGCGWSDKTYDLEHMKKFDTKELAEKWVKSSNFCYDVIIVEVE